VLVRIIGALIAVLCGYACYWSLRWAIADYVVRNLSRSTIEYALRLAPGNPDYFLRLAQTEPQLALFALQRATELNPLGSTAWIELAGAAEERNDFRKAESSLLRAVDLDKTFAPRWLLAEYYFRRRDQAHFWPAVRAALATSYDDVAPLFDMCWDFAPNPETILDRALPSRPDVRRQYFDFLLARNRLDAADAIANQVMQHAGPETVPSLLLYCDRLLEKNEVSRAVETWNLLAAKHLLNYSALAPRQGVCLTNGTFAKAPLSRGFDWRVSTPDEILYRRDVSSPGLRFDFSGKQPEHCELLSQFVPVEPAKEYRFVVNYETGDLEGDPGIGWRVVDVRGGADLLRGTGHMMASERREKAEAYKFHTPAGARLVKLVLTYDRSPGTVRVEGSLSLRNTDLGFDQ
jgi:hypothetical protein